MEPVAGESDGSVLLNLGGPHWKALWTGEKVSLKLEVLCAGSIPLGVGYLAIV